MSGAGIAALLEQVSVMPVLVIDSEDEAAPVARVLRDEGLSVIEVALRTGAALASIRNITDQVKGVVVGAAVIEPGQLRLAQRAGARFASSPGTTPGLIKAARSLDFPFLPGVATPSEAMAARDLGLRELKLFPATAVGGPKLLASMHGPLPDVRFCPTGGLDEQSIGSYLTQPNVLCVGGTWIAPRQAIREGHWAEVGRRAREAAGLAGRVRASQSR